MSHDIELQPALQFSYNQFFIYDKEILSPACDWTAEHVRQGFARRKQVIAVGTLLEFGKATVFVRFHPPNTTLHYERVIAVPLEVRSGEISIDGPEEYPIARRCSVPVGTYRVTIAQVCTGNLLEQIDVFLEKQINELRHSEIILADEALSPPSPLIEDVAAI